MHNNLVKILVLGITLLANNAFTYNEVDNKIRKIRSIQDKYSEANFSTNVSDSNNLHNTKTESIHKRNDEVNMPKQNKNESTEVCVGAIEYCNMTEEEYVQMLNDYIYPQTYEWVLIATHTLVFVMGLVGNALVCVAVYRNHSMRTVTNYFIVNLAVADFMVILVCLPPTVLWDVTETWFFGTTMCKITLYFQSVSVTVSVLTLTFISVDRWYAICFPLRMRFTTARAKVAILVIWAVSLIFNVPELVVLTTEQAVPLRFHLQYLVQCVATWSPRSDLMWHVIKLLFMYTVPFHLQYLVQCVATWSPRSDLMWHVIKLLFMYTVPFVLMTVAYYQIVKVLWRSDKIPGQAETAMLAPAERIQLRSRRKAAKMLAAVVIMFAVCYLPVHLLAMLRYTSAFDTQQNDIITFLALVSHVMCYANSAINPLIYNFMSGKFRREFRRAFCCSVHQAAGRSMTSRITLTSSRKRDVTCGTRRHSSHYGYNTAFF